MTTDKPTPKPIGLHDRDGSAIHEGDIVEYWAGSERHIRQVYLVKWAPEWMRKAKAWSDLTHLCFQLIKDGHPEDDFFVQLFETEKYCRVIGHEDEG